MILNVKTLEKLRNLINEETTYRKGYELVAFFNQLGFHDVYEQGFPSRWVYTDEKLNKINGTPEMDKCIKKVFAPIDFIGRFSDLDKLIASFNQYIAFDRWNVVRKGQEITFQKSNGVNIDAEIEKTQTEDIFLQKEFDISINKLELDGDLQPVISCRIEEIQKCMKAKSSLAVIFLAGSTLEGILLNIAIQNPQLFNSANSAPKDKSGKVKQFTEWGLNNFIDVSHEVGFLKEDVKKFSHGLKDFRNYIHPYEQMSRKFNPDEHTAEICFQVLKAAIYQIGENTHNHHI